MASDAKQDARALGDPPAPLMDVLAVVRTEARGWGYAVAVHGSLARDIDCVAVPWVEHCGTPEEVVAAIIAALGAVPTPGCPEQKPHGRLAWALRLPGHSTYLDLSVIPLVPGPPPNAALDRALADTEGT